MKHFLIMSFLFMTVSAQAAQTEAWELDKAHSAIKFAVDHMMITEVEGSFDDFSMDVKATNDDFSDLLAKLTIAVKSVNTREEDRDDHLRKSDFFDADNFPEIVIENATIAKGKKKKELKLKGKLTIKGVSKDILWDLKHNGNIKDPKGNTRAGFKVTGVINRQDFGIKYNTVLDSGGLAIGNEIRVTGNIELLKKAAEKAEENKDS